MSTPARSIRSRGQTALKRTDEGGGRADGQLEEFVRKTTHNILATNESEKRSPWGVSKETPVWALAQNTISDAFARETIKAQLEWAGTYYRLHNLIALAFHVRTLEEYISRSPVYQRSITEDERAELRRLRIAVYGPAPGEESKGEDTQAPKKRSPYEVLRVPPDASLEQITQAFHELALALHPDQNPLPNAEAAFRELDEAYRALTGG